MRSGLRGRPIRERAVVDRPPRGRLLAAVLIALTLQFVVLGLIQAARDAPTVDEGPDLVAALVTVEDRDLRLNPEHGVLHHAVPGILPVLLADPLLPETDAYADGSWFDHTDAVIAVNDEAGRLDEVVFWFRVAPLLAGAAIGWVLFALGRRLGGALGGLLAAGLWFTTPYMVGLAHLGSLDVSFTLAAAALALALVRDGERPSLGRALAAAIVLGLALATRHAAVVLVPVAVGFVVAHRWHDRRVLSRSLIIVLVAPVLVVWLLHRGLDPVPVDGPPAERFDALISSARAAGPLERLTLTVPMPVEWQAGFAYLSLTADERPAYLLGSSWDGARPWFFPVSAALKLPVTASLAALGGWGLLAMRRRGRVAALPVLVTGGALGVFLVLQPLNLGLRLAVPVIGLAFVGAAGIALVRGRWASAAVGLLAVGQVAATVAAHPTSLAWTPPPFSDGYRALSDSSIDFGQALHAVRRAHEERPFVAVSLVTPRGLDEPEGTVEVANARPEQLVGRVAVGVTPLTVTEAAALSWLRAYCPVEVIEGAVLVYEFDRPPDTRTGPSTPAAPCDGGISRRT